MGKDVFDNVIVDSNILLVRNGTAGRECRAVDMDTLPDNTFPPDKQHWVTIAPRGADPWSILSPLEQSIKTKIEKLGTPLKDWDIQVYRGVTIGCNEAFIIDQEKRDELVAADPKSNEIIKPVLRGRDIRRYTYQWAGKWIINSHNGDKQNRPIDIDNYPAVKKHLDRYYPRLANRQDKGITPYNLRSCAYLSEFSKDKLVWIELVDRGRFAYDNQGIYCEATAFLMTGKNIKYLCAVLNSRIAHWILAQRSPTSGMGVLRWKKVYVEQVPAPTLNKAKQKPFIKLIEQILIAKKSGADTAKLEAEIDKFVYRLYNLTPDEIAVIENND